MNKKMNGVHVYLIINHISVLAIKVIYKFQLVYFVTPFFFFLFLRYIPERMTFILEVKNHIQR